MAGVTVRQIHGDEMLEIMYWLSSYAFAPSPPLSDKTERQEVIRQREGVVYFALFEEDTPVACAAAAPLTQQVRGKVFGMGGLFDVVTHPAARRKGYSTQVLEYLLAALRDAGRPLSCLYPFRESYYERVGYVTFPWPKKIAFEPLALQPLLKKDLGGEVELVLIGDGYDTYRDYLGGLQQRIHGMALFEQDQKARAQQRNNSWLALARVGGELVGVMLYDLRGDHVTEFNLRATRFYYDTSQGRYLLLAWIASHIDQAGRAEVWLPPFEHPETWLADMGITLEPIFRAPMGRILDVVGIGGMKTGMGRFSARVTDSLCPWNNAVWQFETVEGVLQVTSTEGSDCNLSIQALAALVYGTHDPGDFAIRGWGDPSPEVQGTMRRMFAPMSPYLHEYY